MPPNSMLTKSALIIMFASITETSTEKFQCATVAVQFFQVSDLPYIATKVFKLLSLPERYQLTNIK